MRLVSFDPSALRTHLRQHRIADLPTLKRALGTTTDLTVFRKLKPLQPLTSYTHRGRFYTLAEIVRFDDHGLWSHESVWFSKLGTLLATVAAFVNSSSDGYYARDLAALLHAEVQEPLRHLVQQKRLSRTEINGQFLYTAVASTVRRQQTLTRRNVQALPGIVLAHDLQVSADELKAAIVLFYATLDEQQRRLYAGLESLRAGHGGDTLIAALLGMDPHTVARGRRQLLDHDVLADRTRRVGGGRPTQEKKRRK